MLAQMSDSLTDDLLVSHDDCILLSSFYIYIGPTPITMQRIRNRKLLRSEMSINSTQLFLGQRKIIELGKRKNITGNPGSSDNDFIQQMQIRHRRLIEFNDLPHGPARLRNPDYDRLNVELNRSQPYSLNLTADEVYEIGLGDNCDALLVEKDRLDRLFETRTRNLDAYLIV